MKALKCQICKQLKWFDKSVKSDLHEETCQQGSLNVECVVPGAEGGH